MPPRDPAERAWSAQQRFAAIERDQELTREEWRDDRQLRWQWQPMVGLAIFLLLIIGTLVERAVGNWLWAVAGLLLAVVIIGKIVSSRRQRR